MKIVTKPRTLLTGVVMLAALAGTVTTATPAEAAGGVIPWKSIHYPFYPECNTHMSPIASGYGTQTCKGYYIVNSSNYKFTEDNIHACPALGKVQRITLDYVLNPASGGVTWTRVLAGFAMHW
jgi:hypothetical protein